ncbi:MAG: asparagine synthetase B [Balneolaceae bacterium]
MKRTTRTEMFLLLVVVLCGMANKQLYAQDYVLIPMDQSQTNHLKAYGVLFAHISEGGSGQWLLNYRGGSFLVENRTGLEDKSRVRNVSLEPVTAEQAGELLQQLEQSDQNTAAVNLEEVPSIAVYTPPGSLPWDDAVTLVLNYAEVPYDRIYDRDVLDGALEQYDWIHLHHEDFTGQFGKFWSTYRNTPWYVEQVNELKALAGELGFDKVSHLKRAVAKEIRSYVGRGGFLFAMCSGTNTLDLALASDGLDIVPEQLDGDPVDPQVNNLLNFTSTLAFENFHINTDPYTYSHDNVDIEIDTEEIRESLDYFTLFRFSARWDPVPTMLTQNHENSIRGFYGQTTAFRKEQVKPTVVILGETPGQNQVKYLSGNYGEGTFTFYGGHDPEDYMHRVNDPPTDLDLHPNSPGYRLILNNILFPAAEEQKLET